MSISDVTSRMAAIQSQLDMLRSSSGVTQATSTGAPVAGSSVGGTDFGTTLSQITAEINGEPVPTSGSGTTGADVVTEAKKYLGVPYVWGGTSPTGMDCSGLVQLVYKNFGIELPRVSYQQAEAGRPVASLADAQPGDLIAWDNSSRNNGVDHIAIYAGNGMMIEAPRTGLDVRMVPVPTTPDVIRRVLPDGAAAGAPAVSGVGGVGGVPAASTALPAGTPFADLFSRAGAAHGVSPALLSAVARQESGYDPRAVSPAGAQGLMQLMPATAAGLGVTDSFDPTQAVDGAARLLSDLLDRFGRTDLALAAYNAGPGAVMRYDGIPPYPETRTYVSSIMSTLGAA